MPFFSNIATVATYESKLLLRGNFFKIFSLLAIIVVGGMNYGFLIQGESWDLIAIPSNIPYQTLLLFNVFQAIIAVFLSSDFLKRDKKLDTSEVFYVRPLSNAEYVLGKTWGNLRLFLGLNLIILLEAVIITAVSGVTRIDITAYILYFFILSLPTLIYIMGLSFFVMLLLKNQALTFVSVLGYIALTLFYLKEKYYNLFDFLGFGQPLMKSNIVGFANFDQIVSLRFIYLFMGLGFIAMTIRMYGRLPNSKKKQKIWTGVAIFFFVLAASGIVKHVNGFNRDSALREVYLEMNNRYVNAPVIEVDSFEIVLNQQPDAIEVNVSIKGRTDEASDSFIFTLNPSLHITSVFDNESKKALLFDQDHQILKVKTPTQLGEGDAVNWSFSYKGNIDELICYLDIEKEEYEKIVSRNMLNLNKKYAFVDEDYLLLTPETYWYPRPGTGFSTVNTKWLRTFFSHFSTEIHTQKGLFGLAQGDSVSFSDNIYKYKTDKPVLGLTAIIGNYEQRSVKVDNVNFSLLTFKGHDSFRSITDSIQDTIPSLIKDIKQVIEAGNNLDYP
ncbi:MAG: ABC transporter permease, partial [Bacteroidales bacterium]